MTDRAHGFIVILDGDYRVGDTLTDGDISFPTDADAIKFAIGLIKGVAEVKPIIANPTDMMARARVKQDLQNDIWELLKGL